MSSEYRREYAIRLPLPLAQLYTRAHNAKSARDRHDLTYFLFEAIVRLSVAPLVLTYLREIEQGQPRSVAVDRHLFNLARPTAGHWVGMLRELSRMFGARVDAGMHPLGHLWGQLNSQRRDFSNCLALFCRIKHGPDGPTSHDQSVSLLQLFDALVPYRNKVIGHAGVRDAEFYESEIGPLLFPAVNEVLSENQFDFIGPAGSKLVSITEIRLVEKGTYEIGLREVTGLQGERCPPLRLGEPERADLVPNTLAVVWPGYPSPLRLDPFLIYREGELSDEMWFLNSVPPGRYVEYLNYANSKTEQNRAMLAEMAALLTRITGRLVDDAELQRLGEQSQGDVVPGDGAGGVAAPKGRLVGDYEILAELGRGGMGIVYLARQVSLGRLLALKFLPVDLQSNEVAVARFRREMRLLAKCEDPRIIKILASGTLEDGQPYYAMEYVPGCDLEQIWQQLAEFPESTRELSVSHWSRALHSAASERRRVVAQRSTFAGDHLPRGKSDSNPAGDRVSPLHPDWCQPLPAPEGTSVSPGGYVRRAVQLVYDAAEAVASLHAKDIIHRDIKPTNLMLTPDGSRVVLMDFGLAKGDTTGLTRQGRGDFLGTMRYAAPEQLAAASLTVGKPADVRALGIILWELLTRKRLFAEAEDLHMLAPRVLNDDVPLLRSIDSTLSRDLEAIIARATERRVSDRIPDAATLASYLRMVLDGQPLPIRPPSLQEICWRWGKDHRHTVTAAVASLMLVCATIAVAFAFVNHTREKAVRLADRLATTNQKLDISLKNEQAQGIRLKHESAKARFAYGIGEYAAGRTEAGSAEIFNAWKYCPEESPLKAGYERVLLDRLTRGAQASLPLWHNEWLRCAAFSPDGQRVVTGSSDNTARLWDAATGEQIGEAMTHHKPVRAVAFSPDGTRIATASNDGTARQWDAASGRSLCEFLGHKGPVQSILYSPDGSRIVTASEDQTARLWNASTGQAMGAAMRHVAGIGPVIMSLDGSRIVTGSKDGNILAWDAFSGIPIGIIGRHDHEVSSVMFRFDGLRLVSGSLDKTARIWDAKTNAQVGPALQHVQMVHAAAYSPDGTRIISKGWDTVYTWDAETGEQLGVPIAHSDHIGSANYSPDGKRILTASDDCTARLWEASTSLPIGEPLRHSRFVHDAAFSPDGRRILTLGGDNAARLWNAEADLPMVAEIGHGDFVNQCEFSSDSSLLISSSSDMYIRVCEAISGRELVKFKHSEPSYIPFLFFAVSSDEKRIVTWSGDEIARVWNLMTGKPIGTQLKNSHAITSAAISPDATRVVVGMEDGAARIWDVATSNPIGPSLQHDASVTDVRFNSDGSRVLTGAEDSQLRIWDAATGEEIASEIVHDTAQGEAPIRFAISADDRRIVTWSEDQMIRVWDAVTWKQLWTLRIAPRVAEVLLSRNGRHLLAIDAQGTMHSWDAQTGRLLAGDVPLRHKDIVAVALSEDGTRLLTGGEDQSVHLWDTVTGEELNQARKFHSSVMSVALSPDGALAVAGTEDKSAYVWDVTAMPIPRNKAKWFEWLAYGSTLPINPPATQRDGIPTGGRFKGDPAWRGRMRAFGGRRTPVTMGSQQTRESELPMKGNHGLDEGG